MHFFRDGCVTDFCSCKIGIQYILYISSVLESSCMSYTLRFSTLAPGFVLPPVTHMDVGNAKAMLEHRWPSMQSSARCFLALTKKLLFLEMPSKRNNAAFLCRES
jgi:hypothetical protein